MTQERALEVLKTGGNVFLTGEPGAGKTYVLNDYIAWLDACGISVAVTASTGIAATHIGGMTIHSWSGIGARDELTPYDLDRIMGREKTVKRIKKAKVLVIDEISMLDGRLLDAIDTICRTARGNEEVFGGLQVVFVGDFFQLPPIARKGDMARFSFESNAWQRAQMLTCYLTEQHRQEDALLLSLLSSIRRGEIEEEHYTLLSEQKDIGYESVEPTKLYTHNKDVDALNDEKIRTLNTEERVYSMESRGQKALVEGLIKNCLSPQTLILRKEAMVMCTKNNFEAGYVNGTLGRVIDFDPDDGLPVIETADGREVKITSHRWSIEEDGKVLAEITQVPLRLAWAITVHKSQGMSLDAAEIDLKNAFTYGQGYVALSRVRTLGGMKVNGINANALMVDPKVIRSDERFRTESESVDDGFLELGERELKKMHENFVHACGGELPKGKIKKEKNSGARLKTESTYAQTHELLKKGMTVRQIAKERSMAISTIWGHIEKLSEEGQLGKPEFATLVPTDVDWEVIYDELRDVIESVGSEKLKPIYEGAGEKYDYDLVRLGRLFYLHRV